MHKKTRTILYASLIAGILLLASCLSPSDFEMKTGEGSAYAVQPEMTRIWEGEYMSFRKRKVKMFAYIPPKEIANGSACIILPGGSYIWMGIYGEGYDVAEWLVQNGTAAFVLNYRTALAFNHDPAMIQDLQRAIQLVKENAARYNINPDMVGVMGFSAGGHLAGTASEYFDVNSLAEFGIEPKVSLKPAFAAMIYPVITMEEPYVHKPSRKHLLGSRKNDAAERRRMSLEHNVRADMPPVFLVQCTGDKTVDYHNAVMMDEALTAVGVEHKFMLFDEEGHGFGIDPDDYPGNKAWSWHIDFIPWMKARLGLED